MTNRMARPAAFGAALAVVLALLSPLAASSQAGAMLHLNPAAVEIGEGQVETVAIVLENARDAFGIDIRGKFDPGVVEVVPVDPSAAMRPGGFIKPDFLAVNKVDNAAGTFQWAATQVSPTLPANGSGAVVILQLRGKARGRTTRLELTAAEMGDRRGNALPVALQSGNVTIVAPREATAAPTAQPTALPTSVLTPGPQAAVGIASAVTSAPSPPVARTAALPTVTAGDGGGAGGVPLSSVGLVLAGAGIGVAAAWILMRRSR